MITPSFALTATERVLPSMALDFTTASLDSRVTFTRTGNTATVINSSGNVAAINADLPRFDYNPVTLACKGLLIEEARTNLFLYSAEFDNAYWTKTRSSITANATISPEGSLTGDKLVENLDNGTHIIVRTETTTNTSANTWSIYAKAGERPSINISVREATTFLRSSNATFNLSAGTVGAVSNAGGSSGTATIQNAGNGWYRCSLTITLGGVNTNSQAFFQINNGSASSYQGNGTSGIFVWGAQLELGGFTTSIIPTEATTVTRNPDVAVMTSTNFSDWYTATTGAAVVWAIPQTATGVRPLIQFDDTTANEIIVLGGNVANPEMSIVDGGVAQAQIDAGTIVANTAYKLSGAWNTDSCAAAQNGAAAVTDNTATIPTPTQLRIGSDGTNYASAWVQKVLYYPQRIIDAEVQAISK
jgi:hypothetical protein